MDCHQALELVSIQNKEVTFTYHSEHEMEVRVLFGSLARKKV